MQNNTFAFATYLQFPKVFSYVKRINCAFFYQVIFFTAVACVLRSSQESQRQRGIGEQEHDFTKPSSLVL